MNAEELRAALTEAIGDPKRVSTGDSERDLHAQDITFHRPHRPDVVVYVRSTEEVSSVLALAEELRVPVTPFGAGTSLEGHVTPVAGGISLDLTRMDPRASRGWSYSTAGRSRRSTPTRGTDFPAVPTLFVEASGTEASVTSDLELVHAAATSERATETVAERDPTARRRLWAARHAVAYATAAATPGKRARSTDVCVPLQELAGAVAVARMEVDRRGLVAGILGHAGDGNVHVSLHVDPDDPAEIAASDELIDVLVDDALARGGTCTGEHGIGLGKREALEREHPELVPLMRGIKDLFDPHGIMNPGKILRPVSDVRLGH